MNGWLVIDKPFGLTSSQVVGRVKRIIKPKKIGHAGTLDKFATGVLPLAIGEATKTQDYAMDGQKKYSFDIIFGTETDTLDRDGQITQKDGYIPKKAEIEAALPDFTGLIDQTPPTYSAIKINGQRSSDLAREGKEVELASRKILIENFIITGQPSETEYSFEVVCGKGTYIRALARDLSKKLGTCAHISRLERLKVGNFDIKNAISLERLEELVHNGALFESLLPVGYVLDDIPVIKIDPSGSTKLRKGQTVIVQGSQRPGKACAKYGDEVVAIGEIEGKAFRPLRVFNY